MKLSKENFNQWKESQTTKAVLKYLSDWKDQLLENHKLAFESSYVVSEEDQKIDHAKLDQLSDIIDIEFDDIDRFYTKEEDEDEG